MKSFNTAIRPWISAWIATIAFSIVLYMAPSILHAQTIDIGPNQYAFRLTNSLNSGLYFNASQVRYEFRNSSGAPIFGFNANNGRISENLEFAGGADYLVANNRYAFRTKSNTNRGLFFNASLLRYEFLDGNATPAAQFSANSGNLELKGGVKVGNTSDDTAGKIRFNGTDFEGYSGSEWQTLYSTNSEGLQLAYEGGDSILTEENKSLIVEGPGGFLSSGTFGEGDYTTNPFEFNERERLLWLPGKAAFRGGGRVIFSSVSSQCSGYNPALIGTHSFGYGEEAVASAPYTTALCAYTRARGWGATAFGNVTTADGRNSLAAGFGTIAPSRGEVALGCFNTEYSAQGADNYFATDRILSVGNSLTNTYDDPTFTCDINPLDGTRSNALVILKNGRTGIGVDDPTARMHVLGGNWNLDETDGDMMIGGNEAKLKFGIRTGGVNTGRSQINSMGNFAAQALNLGVNGSTNLSINSQGYVGIGTLNPATPMEMQLSTTRTFQFTNASADPVLRADIDSWGFLGNADKKFWRAYVNTYHGVNTSIQSVSDARLKENVEPMEGGLDQLMQLMPVQYDFIAEKLLNNAEGRERLIDQDIKNQMGFIAQEVQEIFPNLVRPLDDDSEILTLGYAGLIPVIVESIQTGQGQIEGLENEVRVSQETFENVIAQKNAEIAALKNKVMALVEAYAQLDHGLTACCPDPEKSGLTGNHVKPRLGAAIPNPFRKSILIEYYLPVNTADAVMRITDSDGRPVQAISLASGAGQKHAEFDTANPPPGNYRYSLFVEGEFIASNIITIYQASK